MAGKVISLGGKRLYVLMEVWAVALHGGGIRPCPSVLKFGLRVLLRIWKSGLSVLLRIWKSDRLDFPNFVLKVESYWVPEWIRNIVPPAKFYSVLSPTGGMQLSVYPGSGGFVYGVQWNLGHCPDYMLLQNAFRSFVITPDLPPQ